MKTRAIVLSAVLCLVTGHACFAKEAYLGTWKLKSSEAPITGVHPVLGPDGSLQFGVDASQARLDAAVVYEIAAEDTVKVTVNGVLVKGQVAEAHYEWTGKFDGKDYPVKGDPEADTWSYRKIDDRTLELTIKKQGQTTAPRRIMVLFHGKTCTVKTDGVTAVYHKQ